MRLSPSASGTEQFLSCPKCGFEQTGNAECIRCGVIFAKYKPHTDASPRSRDKSAVTEAATVPKPTLLSRAFRLLPWLSLVFTIMTLVLLLKQVPPPVIQMDPAAADRVAKKMATLQLAMQAQ
jgi:uncharacterized membrane protein YvbJ